MTSRHILISVYTILVFNKCLALSPHIILIVADDLGWDDVSFHGSKQIPTPNIDALGSTGILLNNYYVSPICTPSRGALMSGRHPIHTGLQHDVIYAGEPWGLPLNNTIMPEYLKRLGYATHAIGKWHLGFFKKEYTPTFRGFDSHYGYYTGHEDYYDHTAILADVGWGIDLHNNQTVVRDALGNYSTELFTNRAADIIRNHNSSQPLFLYLAHIAVHVGNFYNLFQAPLKYVDRFSYIKSYRRKIFAGMVSALDEGVGQVIKALQDASMLDNSIVVFTTDNGGAAGGIDDGVGSNWPLRGSKYTLWEGGVRGTAILWSSLLPKSKGRFSDQLMHITDWLPTLYSAAGGNVKDLGSIYGTDMWNSLLNNLPSPRKELLHNIDPIWNSSALRYYDFKIVVGTVFYGKYDGWYGPAKEELNFDNSSLVKRILESKGWTVNTKHFQFKVRCGPRPANATTNCQPLQSPCLFNIKNDPCEYNNLAENMPEMTIRLENRLKTWEATAVPPGKVPADPQAAPRLHQYAWIPWMD